MFSLLEEKRDLFIELAKEFLPSAIPGLTKDESDLSACVSLNEMKDYYTTFPQMQVKKGAAGFHTNLTSPARPWFRFRPKAYVYGENAEVLEGSSVVNRAMDSATEAVEWLMSSTNCYSQCNLFYKHWLVFGTAAMLVLPDEKRLAKAVTLRPGTFAIDIGADGKVDRLARKFSWTIEQIINYFGQANLPKSLLEKQDKSMRLSVVNLIETNASLNDRNWDKVSATINLDETFSFRSIYFFKDSSVSPETQGIITPVKGFAYNPIVCCRYEHEHGDVWGLGVGQIAMPVARGLNSYKYDLQKVSGDNAEPAVIASSELKDEGLQLGRRGVNWAQPGAQRENLVVPVLAAPRDMSLTKEETLAAQQELSEAFFVSAFATIDALKLNPGVKTATEVEQLVRENLEMLGAHVANLNEEFLDPLVTAHFRIAQDMGIAPNGKAPSLAGMNIDSFEIEYVSAIHLAQKASRLKNTQLWLSLVGQSAAVDPLLAQLPNWEVAMREIQRMMGVSEKIAHSDAEFKRIKEAALQETAQQKEMERLAISAQTGKQIAEMPVDMNHAGGRLAQAMGA
jgi:hypothetical protein